MEIKQFGLLIILLISTSFPQTIDSTATSTDTLYFEDSTKIILPDSALADTSSLLKADTLSTDSLIADTLRPLYQKPFSLFSYFISNYDILRLDYQSAYDLLRPFPLNFIRETGLYGNPADPVLYGAFPPNIAFLQNGVWTSNADVFSNLNLVQTETIDSIEIINLPRSFLYSPGVTPASVNFIEKDFLSSSTYTRIKYFEGPFGQAYFDGIINAMVFKKLNLFLDITNTITDSSYQNSTYDSWQGTVKLKYLFSSKFNVSGSYKLAQTTAGVNGGINVDSMVNVPGWIEDDIYDERAAIVQSANGSMEFTRHNFKIESLWQPDENWNTQFTLYSLFGQNLDAYLTNDSVKVKFKNHTYGAGLNQRYSEKYFYAGLHLNYLNNELSTTNIINGTDSALSSIHGYQISLAPEVSLFLLDSALVPSVFFKYASVKNVSSENYSGLGFDLNYFMDNIKLYTGYSSYHNLTSENNTNNFEIGAGFTSEYVDASLKYFSSSGNPFVPPGAIQNIQYSKNGIGSEITLKYGDFRIEGSGYYNFRDDSNKLSVGIPDFNLLSGIYYKNILFDEHLDIKTGFRVWLSDGDKAKEIFEEPVASLFNNINYRLDFTLAAEISKAAIIIFTWENLTDNRYFIIPFYPMPERNIRFGVAWELFN